MIKDKNKKVVFDLEVDEESFLALRAYAKKKQRPAKQLVSDLIKTEDCFLRDSFCFIHLLR